MIHCNSISSIVPNLPKIVCFHFHAIHKISCSAVVNSYLSDAHISWSRCFGTSNCWSSYSHLCI